MMRGKCSRSEGNAVGISTRSLWALRARGSEESQQRTLKLPSHPLCAFVSFVVDEVKKKVVDADRQFYFFSSSAQFVTTVMDWFTCCEITLRSIFLPSGATS